MDVLFRRYANPFPLVDGMILSGGFSDFVSSFMAAAQEEENEKMSWEYYLHKVFQGSYNDFREAVQNDSAHRTMDEKTIEATVKESMNILNNFNPT